MREEKKRSFELALSRMAKLCSTAEKCEYDIRKKLSSWKIANEDQDKIIERLKELDFLNEKRYANAFAKSKIILSSWGVKKIVYALKIRGIEEKNIEDAIKNIQNETYNKQIQNALSAKLKTLNYKDMNEAKAKLIRFAIGRGYDYDSIYKIIDEILTSKTNE